jgi:hypothetical protein
LVAALAAATAFVSAGCGDCGHTAYLFDQLNTADFTLEGYVHGAEPAPDTWVSQGPGVHEQTIGLIWFNGGQQGLTFSDTTPVPAPRDLRLLLFEPAHSTTRSPPLQTAVGFVMLIHGFSGGPEEIDLDDARVTMVAGLSDSGAALLDGGVVQHGVAGHLSLLAFSSSPTVCTFPCLIRAAGSFSFSATGADGQRTNVTNGVIHWDYSTYESYMCFQQND